MLGLSQEGGIDDVRFRLLRHGMRLTKFEDSIEWNAETGQTDILPRREAIRGAKRTYRKSQSTRPKLPRREKGDQTMQRGKSSSKKKEVLGKYITIEELIQAMPSISRPQSRTIEVQLKDVPVTTAKITAITTTVTYWGELGWNHPGAQPAGPAMSPIIEHERETIVPEYPLEPRIEVINRISQDIGVATEEKLEETDDEGDREYEEGKEPLEELFLAKAVTKLRKCIRAHDQLLREEAKYKEIMETPKPVKTAPRPSRSDKTQEEVPTDKEFGQELKESTRKEYRQNGRRSIMEKKRDFERREKEPERRDSESSEEDDTGFLNIRKKITPQRETLIEEVRVDLTREQQNTSRPGVLSSPMIGAIIPRNIWMT